MAREDSCSIRVRRGLAAVVAAGSAGYSTPMGAEKTRTVRDPEDQQAAVLPPSSRCGGGAIDAAGDSILAEFTRVVNAVGCAMASQNAMRQRNAAIQADRKVLYRIGINLGDVIFASRCWRGSGKVVRPANPPRRGAKKR